LSGESKLTALEERLMLYQRALALRNEGKTLAEIGDTICVNRNTIGWWLRRGPPRRIGRYNPDLSPSKDLAYVAGFYLGDGKGAGNEHKVRFELADSEQIEYVGGLLAKILRRTPKQPSRDGTFFIVDYDSVALSNFLDQSVEKLVDHLKGFKRDFLRGFFDAEGYASCSVDTVRMKVSKFCVGAVNTRDEYLKPVKLMLEQIGLHPHLRRTNKAGQSMTIRRKTWIRKHDVYHVVMTIMPEIKKFQKIVNFRIPAKHQKLADMIRMFKMRPDERYVWFQARYARKGRKWVRIEQQSSF
jgi:intein-encoded DNA endonuclease-like protein